MIKSNTSSASSDFFGVPSEEKAKKRGFEGAVLERAIAPMIWCNNVRLDTGDVPSDWLNVGGGPSLGLRPPECLAAWMTGCLSRVNEEE
jgi:hypothetical protein